MLGIFVLLSGNIWNICPVSISSISFLPQFEVSSCQNGKEFWILLWDEKGVLFNLASVFCRAGGALVLPIKWCFWEPLQVSFLHFVLPFFVWSCKVAPLPFPWGKQKPVVVHFRLAGLWFALNYNEGILCPEICTLVFSCLFIQLYDSIGDLVLDNHLKPLHYFLNLSNEDFTHLACDCCVATEIRSKWDNA